MTQQPVRLGSCIACGLCCRFLILYGESNSNGFPIPVAIAIDPDCIHYLEIHDMKVVWKNGEAFAVLPASFSRRLSPVIYEGIEATRIPLPCRHLLPDGRCGIYGSTERPQVCERFPQHPAEFIGLEDCSYQFTNGDQRFWAYKEET